MAEVRKVVSRLYEFDLSHCMLIDGNEMVSTEKGNEFVNTFIKRDLDKGIIITPSGYTKGLIFKSSNNGEIYNKPEWIPDIVSFSYNIFGLKKGSFYRLTVRARNTRQYNRIIDSTDDRSISVFNGNEELLIKEDLSNVPENKDFTAIFMARSSEENLFFRLGKIYINNIIIDEVELAPENSEEEVPTTPIMELDSEKIIPAAYGIFDFGKDYVTGNIGKYAEIEKISGVGINLYLDTLKKEYYLERDNRTEILKSPFTNANFIIDINTNKAPKAKYEIEGISPDVSPNTLKQGYIRFAFPDKDGDFAQYRCDSARIMVMIYKIN